MTFRHSQGICHIVSRLAQMIVSFFALPSECRGFSSEGPRGLARVFVESRQATCNVTGPMAHHEASWNIDRPPATRLSINIVVSFNMLLNDFKPNASLYSKSASNFCVTRGDHHRTKFLYSACCEACLIQDGIEMVLTRKTTLARSTSIAKDRASTSS